LTSEDYALYNIEIFFQLLFRVMVFII